jgi:hypothetical protein
MTIDEYIQARALQRIDSAAPSPVTRKFGLADSVDFYSDTHGIRYVGICRERNFFAAWKRGGDAGTEGHLDQSYPILQGF